MSGSLSARAAIKHAHPDAYFLSIEDREGLSSYLSRMGWLASGETIQRLSKAGEGNMNCSLRVKTTQRSFIIKQGRPWVEKYPAIAAPWGRTAVEACFYRQIAADPLIAGSMPRFVGDDPGSQILVLEDLGEASDCGAVYAEGRLSDQEIDALVHYLLRLHGLQIETPVRATLANRSMRRLNHEHLFRLPLASGNGLDLDRLTPGLGEVASRLKNDKAFVGAVSVVGELYLADGIVLLHGDYYPGSWLRTGMGVRVIDPEFCFLGPAEFDIAVMAAHLILSDHEDVVISLFRRYGTSRRFDSGLALRFTGVELMRRLIGVAQLPLARDLGWKQRVLERSRRLVLNDGDMGL